jgi:predicted nucleotide-binding protein
MPLNAVLVWSRCVIEKFEDHAADAAFAVVILTSDDVG